MITNKDSESIDPSNRGQINPTQPVQQVDSADANRFSSQLEEEMEATEMASEGTEISPEELHRQIREGLFKNGFNRAMEKAREISKELKNG